MTTYLNGYYGMLNSGDDALMQATAWGAEKFLGAKDFLISTPRPITLADNKKVAATLTSKQIVKGENRIRQYFASAKSNQIVFGGGSVLHNSHDINQKRHFIKLSNKNNALALGVGLGPFANSDAEQACAKFLLECEYVGVRDKASFDMAKSLAPEANVALTFDLAPLLLLNEKASFSTEDRSGVCFCLCPSERLKNNLAAENARLQQIANAIISVYRQTGEPITMLDFNGHASLGDEQVHRALMALLPSNIPVKHVAYNPNPLQVMQLLAGFKCVVGMRLHASILAYLVNTPVVSLNYHSKCKGWCEQIGLAEHLQFDTGDIDAAQLAGAICLGLSTGFTAPTLPVENAIAKSLKNWRA